MVTRRRFLSIAASVAALPLLPTGGATAGPAPAVWRGVAMGAMASMTLVHPDRAAAMKLIERCTAEIERLEAIFSLYRPDSALVGLNRAGRLDTPPLELVEVMAFASALARETDGAFDPTVQPLYSLYAAHFSAPDADPAGPSRERLDAALALVDHRQVEVDSGRIRLMKPGMAITLNGIAQGYVTDRVAALLRAAGLDTMLLDLGELRAAGHHPEGRPWRAGVADPSDPGQSLFAVELRERPHGLPALATSGGYGLSFDPAGRHHHLFDPATGRSADSYASVSVAAPTALLADGLSTALAAAPAERSATILPRFPAVEAHLVWEDGSVERIG